MLEKKSAENDSKLYEMKSEMKLELDEAELQRTAIIGQKEQAEQKIIQLEEEREAISQVSKSRCGSVHSVL